MHSRPGLLHGSWRAILAGILAAPLIVASASAGGPPAGAKRDAHGSKRPAFAGIPNPDERHSLLEAWKAKKTSAAGTMRGKSVAGVGVGEVGRASMVINGAGTVLYTKNFLGAGSTCDVFEIQARNSWQPGTAYVTGDVVRPVNGFGTPNGFDGFNFVANNSGTSGATEPTWPTTINTTVGDNGITWQAIAFDPHEFIGCTPMQLISRASGGAETVIAQEGDTLIDGSQLAGWAEFVAMNSSGKAAFRAALAGYPYTDQDDEGESGIFTAGPGAGALARIAATNTTIGGRFVCGVSAMVGTNDAGQVVFDAYASRTGQPTICDEDNHGLVRFTTGPGNELLVQQGSVVGSPAATVIGFGVDDNTAGTGCGTCEYQSIDGFINSAGHVPVVLNLNDGTQGVFNFTGPGVATQAVRLTAGLIGPRVAINNSDQLVYRANTGGVDRLFRFTPPSTTVTIASVGDVVNGQTLTSIGAFADINNSGNVVFQAKSASGTQDGFYYWDGAVTEVTTGPSDTLASEMITVNDSNLVAYVTGTTGSPDETDGGAEQHEDGGIFLWTKAGGSTNAISVGDTVAGDVVTSIYAQHTSFARRQLSSAGCVATTYHVLTDDPDFDCDEGVGNSGCGDTMVKGGQLFISCGAVCPVITVSPPTLPGGSQGTPYSQQLTASGGTAPYVFTETGALPAGITLTPGGLLAGTPTVSGSFPITVTATDANACTGTQGYTLVIGTATQETITITPSARTIVVGNNGTLTVTINIAQSTDTIVTLTSSNPAVASVPATVTILANQTSASFLVNGVAVGGPVTITAALPPSFGAVPATASVTVVAQAAAAIPMLNGLALAILAALLAAAGILLAKLK